SDYISLSETKSQLIIAYNSITADFIGSAEVLPKYSTHLQKFIEDLDLQTEDLL
ncbi:11553_t:CDS:1, partial [Gigaspora margarita]